MTTGLEKGARAGLSVNETASQIRSGHTPVVAKPPDVSAISDRFAEAAEIVEKKAEALEAVADAIWGKVIADEEVSGFDVVEVCLMDQVNSNAARLEVALAALDVQVARFNRLV